MEVLGKGGRRSSPAVIADVRAAWPAPARRYRLDHDVLFPDRAGSNEALQIDYDLVFDTAWREIDADAKLAHVTPSVDYRV